MDMQLRGKRALVTGASSGIGAAIALELAAEGAAVAVHGRDRTRAEETARQVADLGVQTAVVIGDLARDDEAAAVGQGALEALGGIDILVNNAGAVLRKDNPDWMDVAWNEWIASYSLNVGAALRLAKALSPGMAERGWGRIINISSTAATQRHGRNLDYGTAKNALDNLTVNLSKKLGPNGITVNAVSPGVVVTPAVRTWLQTISRQEGWGDDEDANERLYVSTYKSQAVPVMGHPRVISAMVALIASPISDYLSGAVIPIDGGSAD